MRHEFFGRPSAAYVIIRKENKILMLKRIGPWKPGQYVPPSGHVEAKETLRQAAVREVKEEVNLDINEDDLELKFVAHRAASPEEDDDREYLDFYFETDKYAGELINVEPDKHSELVWIEGKDLDEYPVVNCVREALRAISDDHVYGEFDW